MSVIKITKTKESLELATTILENFFLEKENSSANSIEFEKWQKWFLQKSEQYKSGEITDILYFNQISRIWSFLKSNTSINPEELFEVEKLERKANYDQTPLEKTIPQPLSDQEISKLTLTLFNYLTTDVDQQLKVNLRVESITKMLCFFCLQHWNNENISYRSIFDIFV
jgi:hypothetical protein